MTEQDILEKYKEKIEQYIINHLQELDFLDKCDKDKFVHSYKLSFVKGYREGKAEEKIEIAKSMLAKAMDITIISEITGLSKEEIEKLKK